MTTIYTINGFQGDMWSGPQADTGRHLSNQGLNLAYWQPVGYASGDFPLSGGVANGLAELKNQMGQHSADGSPFVVSSWSEGAIIATEAYYAMVRGDAGWPALSQWKGATAFGNPYRQIHKWNPTSGPGAVPDPGGSGIGGPRNNMGEGTNPPTPDWWHNYAHPGDMYTCCPENQVGTDIRVIFDFVLTQWLGEWDDLFEFITSTIKNPVGGLGAVIMAAYEAIAFYGGGTRQHVNYDPGPSMNYLAGIAKTLR